MKGLPYTFSLTLTSFALLRLAAPGLAQSTSPPPGPGCGTINRDPSVYCGPPAAAAHLTGLSASPERVVGGGPITVTFIFTQSAAGLWRDLSLSSSNPDIAAVPRRVTLPPGQVSGSISVTTRPVRLAAAVTLTAYYDAGPDVQSALLTVLVRPAQIAVFRPSTGDWRIRTDDGTPAVIPLGAAGDLPVPQDYAGKARAQLAVFRPSTAEWMIRQADGTRDTVKFGEPGDLPVPADYLGLGRAQLAVYRPAAGQWSIRRDDGQEVRILWGQATDVPVPGDYLGLGQAQIAVYRPATGEWLVRRPDGSQIRVVTGGVPGDTPVPRIYDRSGRTRVAYYRPADQTWGVWDLDGTLLMAVRFGEPTDTPVPADYLGLGQAQLAVYRPATGEWILHGDRDADTRIPWGSPGDQPVPAPYDLPSGTAAAAG